MPVGPVKEDLDGREAYNLFCFHLGAFHHAYTAVEAELNLAIFMAVTRMSKRRKPSVVMAILGGQRMAPAKDTIKRLLRATKASEKRTAYIESIFAHLGEIQFFRDRLTHHFTQATENPTVWTNMNFAGIKEPHLMEDISFDLSALETASIDLQEIRQRTGDFFNHYVRLPGETAKTPLLPTWQYKPSMLTRDRPIKARSRAKRPRPRKSEPQKSQPKKVRN